MYGLPDDFNTDFLLGRSLEQVCINENQVYFHFDKGLHIRIESAYAYRRVESDAIELLIEVPTFNANVLQLLGSSILQAAGTQDGTLILEFDKGQTLKIFDTSPNYESYTSDFDGKIIIV